MFKPGDGLVRRPHGQDTLPYLIKSGQEFEPDVDIGNVSLGIIQAESTGKKELLQDFPRPLRLLMRPGCDDDIISIAEDLSIGVIDFTIPVRVESSPDFRLEAVQDHVPKNG